MLCLFFHLILLDTSTVALSHFSVLLGFLTTFLRRDYHVILYNSRGVGNSGGSSSWTGFPEAQDLQVVVDLALREVEAVDEIVLLVCLREQPPSYSAD